MINLDWDLLPESIAPFARALADRPDAADELVSMLATLGPRLSKKDAARFALQLRQHLPRNGQQWNVTETFLRPHYPTWYIDALHDHARNTAYTRAIKACVAPGATVLEIGSGSGLFAMMAARAGAAHVYSCESDPIIARIAAENVARNGLADRVTIIPKPADKIELGTDIAARCGLLIHEFSSSTFVVGGTIEIISEARESLLVRSAPVLPCRFQARASLTGDPLLCRLARAESQIAGFEIDGLNPLAPVSCSLPRGYRDTCPLSAAEVVADHHIDQGPPGDAEYSVEIVANAPGTMQGLIHWIAQTFPDGTVYENAPGLYCTWEPVFWPAPNPCNVAPGDKVRLQVRRQGCDLAIDIN